MRNLTDRFDDAVVAIDAANRGDPTIVTARGESRPLALVHGEFAVEWIRALVADPPDAVMLAARAHHLRRWMVPRDSYPAGRSGYLVWRRDQKARHAVEVAGILRSAGFEDVFVARVQALVRRDNLVSDLDAQAVEDAACLVFLETQLAGLIERLDRERLLEVLAKTARKMSLSGRAMIGRIDLPPQQAELLRAALDD